MYVGGVTPPRGSGPPAALRARALVVAPPAPVDLPSGAGGAADLVLVDGPVAGAVDARAAVLVTVRQAVDAPGDGPVLVPAVGPAAATAALAVEHARVVAAAVVAAGIDPSRVVVDLGLDAAPSQPDAASRLAATGDLIALGHPVCVAVESPLGSIEAGVAAAMLAGARLLRVSDAVSLAHRVRRSADVTEALLVGRAGPGGRAVAEVAG